MVETVASGEDNENMREPTLLDEDNVESDSTHIILFLVVPLQLQSMPTLLNEDS
jgi:hypothetical protein